MQETLEHSNNFLLIGDWKLGHFFKPAQLHFEEANISWYAVFFRDVVVSSV